MSVFLDDFSYAVETELVGQTAYGKTWLDGLHDSSSPVVVEGYEGSICANGSDSTAATIELIDNGVYTIDGLYFEHIHQSFGFYFRCDSSSSGGYIVYITSEGSGGFLSLNSDPFNTEPEIGSETFAAPISNSFASAYKLRIILDDDSCQITLYQDGDYAASISADIGDGAGVFGGIFFISAGGQAVYIDKLTVGTCGTYSFSDPDPFTLTYGTAGTDLQEFISGINPYTIPEGSNRDRVVEAKDYFIANPTLATSEGGGVWSLTYYLPDDPDYYYSVTFRFRVTEDIAYLEICFDDGWYGATVFVSSIYSYELADDVYALTGINNAGIEITSCDFTDADDTVLNDVEMTNGFEWVNSAEWMGYGGSGFAGNVSAIIKSNKAGMTNGNNGWGNLVNLGVPDYDISCDYFPGVVDGRLEFYFRMPNTAIRGSGLMMGSNFQASSGNCNLWLYYIGADNLYSIWANNPSAFTLPMGSNGVKLRAVCSGSNVRISIESNDDLFDTISYDYTSGLTGTYFAFGLYGDGCRMDNFQAMGVNTDVYGVFPANLDIQALEEAEDKATIQDLIDTAITDFIDNLDDSPHYICDMPESQIVVYGSSGSGPDQVQIYFDMRYPELRVDYNSTLFHVPLDYGADESEYLASKAIVYNAGETKRLATNFRVNYTGAPEEDSEETFDDVGSGGVVVNGTAIVSVAGDTTGLKFCALIVDHTLVKENGTYAVLVNGDRLPSELFAAALDDFGDVIFCSSLDFDGDRLPCEIVAVDTEDETAEIWVPVLLSSTTDTTFYVVWGTGNESQPDADATYGSQEVWDSTYSLVYHFADANDSTANANNGSASNLTDNAGALGSAKSFNGSSSVINIPDDASYKTSDLTVYGFVKPASSGNAWQKVLSLDYYANGGWSYPYTAYELTYNPAGSGKVGGNVSVGGVASGQNSFRTSSNYTVGDWEFVAMNYSTSTGYNQVFLNADYGNRGEYYSGTSGIQYGSSQNLTIGQDSPYYSSPGEAFSGLMDEVRIKNVCDSFARIETERNIFTSGDFLTVGEVEEGESGDSFDETATGGLACSGYHLVGNQFANSSTGGLVCSGSHSVTVSLANRSTGGLVCSGSANDSLMQLDLVGSGGLTLGGSALCSLITSTAGGVRVSGGSAINGTTNLESTAAVVASGSSTSFSAVPGTGGITVSGFSIVNQSYKATGTGGLLAGSEAKPEMIFSPSANGGAKVYQSRFANGLKYCKAITIDGSTLLDTIDGFPYQVRRFETPGIVVSTLQATDTIGNPVSVQFIEQSQDRISFSIKTDLPQEDVTLLIYFGD